MKNPVKYLGNEEKYLKAVLNSETWTSTSGSWTSSLEKEFAKKFQAKYAIAFNSGTSTMHSALLAAGIKPGDEVISPALTVIMNTTATIHANAIPIYADICPDTFTIDPVDIERKITSRTKAIMVVSIYGLPCDMDPIMKLAKKYNLFILEDNAECFLSNYKNKMTGTIGDMASYSFENSKHMSCGEGGMLITNNERLAIIARKVGNHGFLNQTADEGRVKLNQSTFQHYNFKRHDSIGWNYRLSEFNSAIALAQLERLDALIKLRVDSAEILLNTIKDCDFLIPQFTPEYCNNSFWALALKYEGQKLLNVSWEQFQKKYLDMGGDGFYGAWRVPYLEPVISEGNYRNINPSIYEKTSYKKGLCPIAEQVQKKLMVFKTNYRSLKVAEKNAEVLKKVIDSF